MKNCVIVETESMEFTQEQKDTSMKDDLLDVYYVSPLRKGIKRLFDIVFSVVGMVILSPLYLWISMKIRREDGGPVIFSQERIGFHGETFVMYKFRSMSTDAEKDGIPQLCQEDDERLTKVGKFLREHHLDELPQLWNVLKGDMSFVGYRPERKCFVDMIMEHNPDYRHLYRMRPGLFSEATLFNGYTDTMDKMLERLRLDLKYIANYSPWFDVKIIWLTACSIISGKKF